MTDPITVSLDPMTILLVVLWAIQWLRGPSSRADMERLMKQAVSEQTSMEYELLKRGMLKAGRAYHPTPVHGLTADRPTDTTGEH